MARAKSFASIACTPAVYSAVCFLALTPSPPPPPPAASAGAGRSRNRSATKSHAMRRRGAVMTASGGSVENSVPAVKRARSVPRSADGGRSEQGVEGDRQIAPATAGGVVDGVGDGGGGTGDAVIA